VFKRKLQIQMKSAMALVPYYGMVGSSPAARSKLRSAGAGGDIRQCGRLQNMSCLANKGLSDRTPPPEITRKFLFQRTVQYVQQDKSNRWWAQVPLKAHQNR